MMRWTFTNKVLTGERMVILTPDAVQPWVAARFWQLVGCEAVA